MFSVSQKLQERILFSGKIWICPKFCYLSFKKNYSSIHWAVFEWKIKDEASVLGSVRTPKNCVDILQCYVYLVGIGCNNQYVWSILYATPTCSEYNSEKNSKIRRRIRCKASFFDGTLIIYHNKGYVKMTKSTK